MAKILGLDIGTNSIGWAVIDNEKKCIDAAGSRIIPMDAGRLNDFEKGNSVSQTADRTKYRGARRLHERFLLRRERLLRVLKMMEFLPEHYASQLSRYGHLPENLEPRIAWREGKDGKPEFLFRDSFNEMVEEFRQAGISQNIPYDWTIYYLRKKALSQPLTKEELAWILMQFNQKRGYNQLRGKDDEEMGNSDEKGTEKEYFELRVIKVEDSGDKYKKGGTWHNITLENGWVYRRVCRVAPDWEGKTRGFIATFKLNKDGQRKEWEQPSLRSPDENDWGLRKIKTENDICQSGHTVGEYIYNTLKTNPSQKIIGEAVRTVDRALYKDELYRIIDKQRNFIPELNDHDLYNLCIEELYPSNDAFRNSIANRDFKYLLVDDILFYQRPLKSKKSLIADCPYEKRNGKPIKCIAKSHPLFQEYRLWQFLADLRVYRDDKDITPTLLPDGNAYADLYNHLACLKEIDQNGLLRYFKIGKKDMPSYRWKYVQDRKYPCGETRAVLLGGLRKAGIPEKFLTPEKELQLWHMLYSVDDHRQYENALKTFAHKQGWTDPQCESFVQSFRRLTVCKEKDYGAYSAKAIGRLLPLMRRGRYWKEDDIDELTCNRIEHIITGEEDEKLTAFVREKFKEFHNIEQYQGLNPWQACYLVYGRHSEAAEAKKWTLPEDIDEYLKEFRRNSLNNPIVEQVVTESLRVVRDIWKQTGHIDEIHIELGRELKKTKSERESISQTIMENEATNQRIRLLLTELMNPDLEVENVRPNSPSQLELLKIYEEGVMQSGIEIPDDIRDIQKRFSAAKNQPTHAEVIKYKLWLDQKYRSPYTGKHIPLAKLFTPAYQIEHIIPQALYFDDSLSNKVICEAEVNKLKDRELGHEFIMHHRGERVQLSLGGEVEILSLEAYEKLVKETFANSRKKREKLMLDEIPEDFINRQLNDSRYISKLMMHLLSNIVRAEDEDGNREDSTTSRNVIPCNGAVTDRLKHDWSIDDVWNRIILPRFKRMNDINKTSEYTTTTERGHLIPQVPLNMRQGFNKKRIDHRHHAMDALVIACATRDHVNLLNNEAARSSTRYDLNNKLRVKGYYIGTDGQKHERFGEFYKPWDTFTEDVQRTLEGIIVSFKQNLRVINKTSNYYSIIQNGKRVYKKQEKGDSWAIRKALHKETVFGEVNLQLKTWEKLKDVMEHPDRVVDKELKDKIKEMIALRYSAKDLEKFFENEADTWPEVKGGKVEVYYYTADTNDRCFATRYNNELTKYLGTCSNETEALEKINKITDTGIQKILRNHLFQENHNPQQAFCPEGIEKLNANITQLNEGKKHHPIKKVRVYTKGVKFRLTDKGSKSNKYYNGDDGKNLHYIIYTCGDSHERHFQICELNVAIECQKLFERKWRVNMETFLKEYGKDEENNRPGILPNDAKIMHIISSGDYVYVPSDEEKTPLSINNLIPEHIYRVRSFDNNTFYGIPISVANVIKKGVEFGSHDKTQKDYNQRMIRDLCIPIQVDRLGNITKIG